MFTIVHLVLKEILVQSAVKNNPVKNYQLSIMWPTGGRQRHQKLPNKEVTKIHVGCGSMLKFVIHWKHLLHFFFFNDANNSASHPQWNSPWGNETDTKRRGQKECNKFNSIVSLEKDNLLASCHPPPQCTLWNNDHYKSKEQGMHNSFL